MRVRGSSPTQATQQTAEHSLYLNDRIENGVLRGLCDERKVVAQDGFALQLASRAHGYIQEAAEFTVSPFGPALVLLLKTNSRLLSAQAES